MSEAIAREAAYGADEISRNIYLNVMDPYWPCGEARQITELSRPIMAREYQEAQRWPWTLVCGG